MFLLRNKSYLQIILNTPFYLELWVGYTDVVANNMCMCKNVNVSQMTNVCETRENYHSLSVHTHKMCIMIYHKSTYGNIGMPNKNIVTVPKNETIWLYNPIICPKDAERMAISVDPDQTAPFKGV